MASILAVVLAALAAGVVPARGDDARLDWPLRPRPAVARAFDAPSPDWTRGHRGVDLVGAAGQPVYAAGAGTVVYAGPLAGRPVVSLAHPGGLHTSYEPVTAGVRAGQSVGAGTVIGELAAGHPGCPVAACLHWSAMWGPASRADYLDPLGLLASTPIRLKPLRPEPTQHRPRASVRVPGRHAGVITGSAHARREWGWGWVQVGVPQARGWA